ncbi:flagellin N-terminal helical domain-containing protein [Acetobacter orientalis]|uniref:flagellin N-terminal helical domain-containing protein n=1 Tax=Acetobacter orientalis TaxID=146474 RepID=UPI000A384B9A|nr:flagellin [Acetobacter orientalis]
MSLSVNNNSSSLVALESLNAAQAELSKAENTISTGKKVDNAADSPAVYAIAAQMNGNLQGMGAVSDSLSLGAQVVATANTAGNKIMDSLQTLQGTLTTAGQTGTDASAMATQILSTLDSVNSYARNATFSGVNLLTSGSDAVNAYNGTTLDTLVNVQGQTQTFKTMAGNNTTLVDALGLTSASASGSSAADSTQNIFASLTKDNVADLKTGNLKSDQILLGNGTTAGSTVTVNGKTFEFVKSGASVSTATNVAVSLDSGFSTKNALSALVSSMNGAGVNASLNSDNSIAVYTGGTNPASDVTGTLVGQSTSQAYSITGTTFAVGNGSDTTGKGGDKFTIGGQAYELVSDTTNLGANGKTNGGSGSNIGIVVAANASATDVAKALADAGITGLTASGAKLTYTVTGSTAGSINFAAGDETGVTSNAAVATSGTSSTTTAITATNGSAADQIAVGIKGGVTTAVSSLQSAITNMSSVMQNLGNYSNTLTGMSTYTKSLTDAVTNGVSALTDADMAAASAKLTSLQTKQSLAIKSLTIANGQSQNILSLFQG